MRTQPARRTGWLYQLPPWRAPRIRRHHHHHHDLDRAAADGIFSLIGRLFLAYLFLDVWLIEVTVWAMVWYYYGLFLGARWIARWIWRHNPIGQTIDSRHAAKERRRPAPYDPHGAPPVPIDLGALGGQLRDGSYD